MTEQYQRLTDTLREIFQMDRADLDFGIYRIMNMKRQEMNDFLEKRLLAQVERTLQLAGNDDTAQLQKELTTLESTLRNAGVDIETNAKVLEMRTAIKAAGSPDALANEVFSHLTAFFRRYYHQGDFISQRRYKKDVYAIPYEGEEVKLHWANHDQYYIKTGEHFRNYSFRTDDGRTISFNLRDAATEKDNNKGKNRFFRLCEEDFITEEGGELKIWFTYEPTDKKEKQPDLNSAAIDALTPAIPTAFRAGALKLMPTEKNKGRTLLEKHLTEYTARNSFDYFIHKDLGGFLNRELDFYIKNEILQIDDIDLDRPERFDRQLRIIKALKQTARDIIALLAQLENFQKRLWLKKKFVVQSDWCITLDRIPEEFYPDIAANTAQREEWVKLFAIDEIRISPSGKDGQGEVAYSEPLTVDFLKANPYLQIDTKHYPRQWKYRLLGHIENLDEQTDGLLINSENFQALNLLQERYHEQVKCIYIDPPYNTDASSIIYKNDYKDSSWLSLMYDRLHKSSELLNNNGILAAAIDDEEVAVLRNILGSIFIKEIGIASVRSNPQARKSSGRFSPAHEYAVFYGMSEHSEPASLGVTTQKKERYPFVDDKGHYAWLNFIRSGNNDLRSDRPKLYYPIFVKKEGIRIPKMEWDGGAGEYRLLEKPLDEEEIVYPISYRNGLRVEKNWQRGHVRVTNELGEYRVRSHSDGYSIDFKTRMDEESLPTTWWDDKEYASANHGSAQLKSFFGDKNGFSFPKAEKLVRDCLVVGGANMENFTCLDYFSGSGTTGHAVINLNREDGGKRKYILVEMGTYFNTVTKPRIQKVAYSKEWKDGKPVGREGVSHCFKYLRLEGYEDTLNNLRMERSAAQSALLAEEHFGHEYTLHYMLGHESRESLLNLDMFKRPFGHTLLITENNETKEQEVDLVETFNYLIGLVVRSIEDIRGTIVVQGHLLNGDKVLIIWRDVEQMDNKALDAFFLKQAYNTRDTEFRRIFVNGDNNLQNLRTDDEQWKVTLIEEEFGKRMFECKDV